MDWWFNDTFSIVAERSVNLKLSGLGLLMRVRTRVAKDSREFWGSSDGVVAGGCREDEVDEGVGAAAVKDGGCRARGLGPRLVRISPTAVGMKVMFVRPDVDGGGVGGR